MPGLRVFLSSTATDLFDYRQIADDTLLRLQQQSVVMERFGARPGAPVDECERLAASCDLLVCIVAHRYGYEPEVGRGSITRREVEAAHRAGKPVYAWIVDDKHPWTQPKEQDRLTQPDVLADAAKAVDVATAVKELHDFKAWLRNNFVTESFTTADDLGRKIAMTLANVAAVPATTGGGSVPAQAAPELRIVHALQPAPYFTGRDDLVQMLSSWVDDSASPDRVHALVAVGGTGKTAIVEQVIASLQERWPLPGAGHVLVWSFYEKPDADAFLRECAQLFLSEADNAPAGGRLERLQRSLRDGRPHLIVLDGLERVQADAGADYVRGQLQDHALKLLLQAIAWGLGRTRALVTSRFPLIDLRDWQRRGVVETALEDLTPDAARRVLRDWGVLGEDAQLDSVCAQLGRHALSVAVVGSYVSHFEAGRIETAAALKLDAVTGDDLKAAKLARVLAFYAERLPAEERELLARLSVFPRGITLDMLGTLVDAGGEVAGVLVNRKPSLTRLLSRLLDRGLVFRYIASEGALTWTAHPFVRERFAALLGCPAEEVFCVVAARLGQGLEARPDQKPEDTAMLDRYEQLIEATRLAGRTVEAYRLYWAGLGAFGHLGKSLGEYARGYRVLRGFLPASGDLKGFGAGLNARQQSNGLNELSLFAISLGKLREAADVRREDDIRKRALAETELLMAGLLNTLVVTLSLGHLNEALAGAHEALAQADQDEDDNSRQKSLTFHAIAHHRMGNVAAARDFFGVAASLQTESMLYGGLGQFHARHCLDIGDIVSCVSIVERGLLRAQRNARNYELPGWYALLARVGLAERQDPRQHIDEIRTWTARTGDMEWILEAHDLASRAALSHGDLYSARAEADDGLRQARVCGYRLRQIELLITQSAIDLAWPDAGRALSSAREALDLATAPECQYAWGEADAAHAWGLAFEARGEREHAQRAFTQALTARERIEHPQADVTRASLARLK